MTSISIVGTGNMGQAIAALAGRGGHSVQLLGEGDTETEVSGEIVVLAVPFDAVTTVIADRGDSFRGRIVVDITNPVNFETLDSLMVPADSSASAQIASALPGSRVIKAFNSTFAATLTSGKVGDHVTTVLIAGDDADAKAALADLVFSGGLKAIDVGSLKRARELEAFGMLQITLAAAEKVGWTGGFGVIE
jgi:NADPH-dependent F420 reductase